MNQFFGAQLRRELVELIDRSELLRNRAQSNGSHRLSSDSTEQTNNNYLAISQATFQLAGF